MRMLRVWILAAVLAVAALVASGELPPAFADEQVHGARHDTNGGNQRGAEQPPEGLDLSDLAAPAEVQEQELTPYQLVGRLHPLSVHMPIAWLLGLLLIEFAALVKRSEAANTVGRYWVALTALSFVPAAITGLVNYGHYPDDAELVALATTHRNVMLLAATSCFAAWWLRWTRAEDLTSRSRIIYAAVLALAFAAATVGGHAGGQLALGKAYLPAPILDDIVAALAGI